MNSFNFKKKMRLWAFWTGVLFAFSVCVTCCFSLLCSWVSFSFFSLLRLVYKNLKKKKEKKRKWLFCALSAQQVSYSEWSNREISSLIKKRSGRRRRESRRRRLKFPRCSWMHRCPYHNIQYEYDGNMQRHTGQEKTTTKRKTVVLRSTQCVYIYMIHQASVLIHNMIR